MGKSRNIRVCKGPGCKAWESEEINQRLRDMTKDIDSNAVKVRMVPCMNKCGGGACIKVSSSREVVKLQKPSQVRSFFAKRVSVPIVA